jgi:alanine dehydrogenase
VRGIEGIPQGDLDRWELGPDDPAWDAVPASIPHAARRTVVSCYSWPGVRPEPCMRVYGAQLAPVLETLVTAGGLDAVRPDGTPPERALWRATLRAWLAADTREAGGDAPEPEPVLAGT